VTNLLVKFLFFFAVVPSATAQIGVSGRHMMVIEPGVERVVGSYMFGVVNAYSEPKEYTFDVLLPKETLDFGPQDGLSKDDIKLSPDGKVMIKKTFPPGFSYIAVGFMAGINGERGSLNFNTSYDMQEISFITSASSLKMSSDGMVNGTPENLNKKSFKGIITQNVIPKGTKIVVNLDGLVKGRGDFIILGAVFSVLVLAFVLILAIKTRPKDKHQSELAEVMEVEWDS